jgi:hypothetical protein
MRCPWRMSSRPANRIRWEKDDFTPAMKKRIQISLQLLIFNMAISCTKIQSWTQFKVILCKKRALDFSKIRFFWGNKRWTINLLVNKLSCSRTWEKFNKRFTRSPNKSVSSSLNSTSLFPKFTQKTAKKHSRRKSRRISNLITFRPLIILNFSPILTEDLKVVDNKKSCPNSLWHLTILKCWLLRNSSNLRKMMKFRPLRTTQRFQFKREIETCEI